MDNKMSLHKFTVSLALALVLTLGFHQVAQAICIKTKTANLRKGPGTKFERLWEVLKYMPLKKIGKKGDWYRVRDVDGDTYWAHRKLFSTKFKCAVISKKEANLRVGPGTKYKKVHWSPVKKYFSLKVLKIKGNWVHVMDAAGDKAWVYRPLVWIQ